MHNIHTYIARLAIVVFHSLLYRYELAVYMYVHGCMH